MKSRRLCSEVYYRLPLRVLAAEEGVTGALATTVTATLPLAPSCGTAQLSSAQLSSAQLSSAPPLGGSRPRSCHRRAAVVALTADCDAPRAEEECNEDEEDEDEDEVKYSYEVEDEDEDKNCAEGRQRGGEREQERGGGGGMDHYGDMRERFTARRAAELDAEGRALLVDFGGFVLFNLYVPAVCSVSAHRPNQTTCVFAQRQITASTSSRCRRTRRF